LNIRTLGICLLFCGAGALFLVVFRYWMEWIEPPYKWLLPGTGLALLVFRETKRR
jgi:hypothetical protein